VGQGQRSRRGQCLMLHLPSAVQRLRHDRDLPLAAPALRASIPLPRIQAEAEDGVTGQDPPKLVERYKVKH
jgi:hypothetical protein